MIIENYATQGSYYFIDFKKFKKFFEIKKQGTNIELIILKEENNKKVKYKLDFKTMNINKLKHSKK